MKKAGEAEQECPLAKGKLCVVVVQKGTHSGIEKVEVSYEGKSKGKKRTNSSGIAQINGLSPGEYSLKLTNTDDKYKDYLISDYQEKVSVSAGKICMVNVSMYECGDLAVHIQDIEKADVLCNISISGPKSLTANDVSGEHIFTDIPTGDYTIAVNVNKEAYKPNEYESKKVVVSGKKVLVKLEVKALNKLTPTLILEADNAIASSTKSDSDAPTPHIFRSQQKEQQDTEQTATLCEVKVGVTATNSVDEFTGDGVFSILGPDITLWEDRECKKAIVLHEKRYLISNDKLTAGHRFFVRGEKASEGHLQMQLNASKKENEIIAPPKSESFKVTDGNKISPQIKVEHLVVLLDKELHKEQRKNDSMAGSDLAEKEKFIYADATFIELSAICSGETAAYTGKGKLTITPANVSVFSDEACETELDISKAIDFEKLTASEPFKIWLRGKTAGKFKLKFEMEASSGPSLVVEPFAEGEMGCVELKLKAFDYKTADVNKSIDPDVDDLTSYWDQLKALTLEQKEMTPAERVGTGRLLHMQDAEKNSRAKIILEKADASQWPDAAKDYKIVVNLADSDKKQKTRTGELTLFNKNVEGDNLPLPHKLKLDELTAEDLTFWVEGKTNCDTWRDIRMSVGFTQKDESPDIKTKLDGDWCVFTVIKIKEVKCLLENVAGQEKFIDGDKVFINLDNNGRLLKTVAGKRKAQVWAQIEPALKDIDIYFSVVEHNDNYKITDLPDNFKETKIGNLKHTLKPTDRSDRKKLLHMNVKTDDTGKAKIDKLKMPQLGLAKFKIGAYILADAPQARFVDEHADLKKQSPILSDTWLIIYRRVFYKLAVVKRWSGTSYEDRFDKSSIESKLDCTGIALEQVGTTVVKDFVRAEPNVLDWSRAALGGNAPPRTMYLCLINGRGDKGDSDRIQNLGAPTFKTPSWGLKYRRLRDLSDNSTWLTEIKLTHDGQEHDIEAVTTMSQTEDFKMSLSLDLTSLWDQLKASNDEAYADDMLATASIKMKYKEADSSSGVSWGEAVVVCMDTREPKHATKNAKDSASHTFLHEIGHYLGLAGKYQPNHTDTLNPNFYSEKAGELSARNKGGYGKGPHCDGLADQCIVWYQFQMTLDYCNMCNLMLRSRDLHSLKAVARDKF